eukprot:12691352-Alexandrium_andersonii.AAC.1
MSSEAHLLRDQHLQGPSPSPRGLGPPLAGRAVGSTRPGPRRAPRGIHQAREGGRCGGAAPPGRRRLALAVQSLIRAGAAR